MAVTISVIIAEWCRLPVYANFKQYLQKVCFFIYIHLMFIGEFDGM